MARPNPPATRLKASEHLRLAAGADLGSETETYHLTAATAEGLHELGEAIAAAANAITRAIHAAAVAISAATLTTEEEDARA